MQLSLSKPLSEAFIMFPPTVLRCSLYQFAFHH
jgi:hypothetical protein